MNPGEVADLVDDQERGAGEEAESLAQLALALRLGERGDDVGGGIDATLYGGGSKPTGGTGD